MDFKDEINKYRIKIENASKEFTKKEAFKDLLNRMYKNDESIISIIDKISAGAEHTILNIPRKDKLHRGSADTYYNNIIIEFENDLRKTLPHAKEQLAGYLLGKYKKDKVYNYTLIASDFINWKVFAIDVSCIENLDTLKEEEVILNEITDYSFQLTESNTNDFFFWLDRFLFKSQPEKATLKNIEYAFGYNSAVFVDCYNQIYDVFDDAKKYGEVQVSYEQWLRFLKIAYGSFEGKYNDFVIHTYLSIFSKMLAYAVVSNDDYIDDEEMKAIIDGSIFHNYNIKNFVENDFFYWIKLPQNFKKLKKVFRLIAQEISTFNFINVDEDILKGVYQELIDLDTRHSLGEYYTPDWLCQTIVNEFDFKTTDKILDPSCGSGSFLRAAISQQKKLHPAITTEQLNNSIYGIDIHPLSVQIAKTTILLALGKDIKTQKNPLYINVFLANTILAPKGVNQLFGSEFKLSIDKHTILLNTQILDDNDLFNIGVEVCDDFAEQTMNKKSIDESSLIKMIKKEASNSAFNGNISHSFYEIYKALKAVKENGRDSIWSFILKNLYKPYFLQNRFDYVIGNPPWFTFSSVKNEDYQIELNTIAEQFNVKPESAKDFPHLEIAAIFLAYCNSYFLKDTGKLAFVLPRSFFNASQHSKTRLSQVKALKLTEIWDLEQVKPLFNIPSCVLFSQKAPFGLPKSIPQTGLKGRKYKGNMPSHNCNLENAQPKLQIEKLHFFVNKQGKNNALSTQNIKDKKKANPYKTGFKQGATIVPRCFYFVDFKDEINDINKPVPIVKTAEVVKADAKKPWTLTFENYVNKDFLFYSALSNNIFPFYFAKPILVHLPIEINHTEKIKNIQLLSADDVLKKGIRHSYKWFSNTENIWNIHKTAKSKNMQSTDRINYQKGITSQNLNAPYLVLYNASAKDANATIVKREDYDLEFIVESVCYVYYTNNLNEAYYLTAIFNSSSPNKRMKDFQAKGLFGPRHVHKKILDVYFPKYIETNKQHKKLAVLSQQAHEKAKIYIAANPSTKEIKGMVLGKLRVEIKKHLHKELQQIDEIVDKLLD